MLVGPADTIKSARGTQTTRTPDTLSRIGLADPPPEKRGLALTSIKICRDPRGGEVPVPPFHTLLV